MVTRRAPTTDMMDACPTRPPLYVAPLPINAATGLPVIRKVFIANRGEIACRVIATCQKLNVQTALLYVEEDEGARHILEADDAVNVGSINDHRTNPFLNMGLLIDMAKRLGADAIHPGYGYLSEKDEFVTKTQAAGLIFIGPSAQAMSTLGDKRSSKVYLQKHAPNVPLIAGFSGTSTNAEDLEKAATAIGYPVMLKASAGGGGKGMRIVREAAQLREELERVQSEAARSFGSADCILEKYIENSKHVEVQIMGDHHEHVVSFFERDCSVQRRHQKVVEESPCPFLTPELRKKMSDVAVSVAKAIGYANAGTVEFVLDVQESKFYFLEVNARLQVEHPITEEVTGTDLVAMQLFVASGGDLSTLPHVQNLKPYGHAIELRLCAEDPQRDFFPEHGVLRAWTPPSGPLGPGRDIRYETAMQTGCSVSIHFDSMIAKLVVWAPTRSLAVHKIAQVAAQTSCVGVKTNQLFLQQCLLHPVFHDPTYNTSFIPRHLEELLAMPAFSPNLAAVPALVLRSPQFQRVITSTFGVRSAFRLVRSQFRNQHRDPVGVLCDVITTDLSTMTRIPDSGEKPSTLLVWAAPPASPARAGNGAHVSIISVPTPGKDEKPAKKDSNDIPSKPAAQILTGQYNTISNILRGPRPAPIQTHLAQWIPIDDPQPHTFSCFVDAVIDGQVVRAHCIVPDVDRTDGQHTVYCHFPHLGCHVKFDKDTLLSYTEGSRKAVESQRQQGQAEIKAPMPCKILSIKVNKGDEVAAGDVVMILESMKMEVSIKTSKAGKFHTLWKAGDAVNENATLCTVN
ncbi:hypothetical protein SEUCBS139899_002911 [Sporothrix eucalyptigena]|uniref:3-methylcrotonyl-CoA carboxylase alpha subunit n=1 Tax=Sporothrix eucalyptigena TaxID=1812306 RepID=A0ABP0CZD1_9PEZI